MRRQNLNKLVEASDLKSVFSDAYTVNSEKGLRTLTLQLPFSQDTSRLTHFPSVTGLEFAFPQSTGLRFWFHHLLTVDLGQGRAFLDLVFLKQIEKEASSVTCLTPLQAIAQFPLISKI